MSRVGKKPIPVPAGVVVTIVGSDVSVKGPKGVLNRTIHGDMKIEQRDGTLVVERPSEQDLHRALHGLTRTLVSNMVEGVTNGYRKEIEIIGVGYRAQMQGTTLNMLLGYSHPIDVPPPGGISFEVAGNNRVSVVGIDKELVGQTAANLRKWRPPEPYKGKGVRYENEVVRRKEGKSFASGSQ